MSMDLVRRVYQKKIDAKHQRVLVLLCDFANDDGVCWPSIDRIAWKLSVSERTVMRAVKDLEAVGCIEVRRHHRRANTYLIDLERLDDKPPYIPPYEATKEPPLEDKMSPNPRTLGDKVSDGEDKMSSKNGQNVTQLGDKMSDSTDKMSPQPLVEPLVEPSEEPPYRASPKKRAAPLPDDFGMSDERLAYALSKGLDHLDADVEIEKLRNWAHGNGTVKKDWDAMWRNWVLTAVERRSSNRRGQANGRGNGPIGGTPGVADANGFMLRRKDGGYTPEGMAAMARAEEEEEMRRESK